MNDKTIIHHCQLCKHGRPRYIWRRWVMVVVCQRCFNLLMYFDEHGFPSGAEIDIPGYISGTEALYQSGVKDWRVLRTAGVRVISLRMFAFKRVLVDAQSLTQWMHKNDKNRIVD